MVESHVGVMYNQQKEYLACIQALVNKSHSDAAVLQLHVMTTNTSCALVAQGSIHSPPCSLYHMVGQVLL